MKKLTTTAADILVEGFSNFFDIHEYKNIIDFSLEDIDLSDDVSADKNKIDFENYPYMVQPLRACQIEDGIRKTVCLGFPEQMGKSMIALCVLLHGVAHNQLQAIICYPSLDLAVETSTVKFIPLFKKIPQFAEDIEKPFAIRSDRLKLSNAIIYWQGAGTKIVSKSAKLVLADECAIWQDPPNINNLLELKKRTRSYAECLQLFVSTPRYKEDNFWREWLGGSQGYYFLRCQHCGELTLRSCDIHNLQFQSVYDQELKQYVVVRGSERLICPQCKYEHTEAEREKLVKGGGYIHKYPSRVKTYPTFQAGALASLLNVHSWSTLAEAQLSSGKSSTLTDYENFDNSIRGLPYQQRDYNKQDETQIQKHFYKKDELKPEEIEAIFLIEDTQDTFSVLGVFALTISNSLYLLQVSRPRYLWLQDEEREIINAENKRNKKPPEETVLDYMDKDFYGLKPLCLLADMRGHRTDEIKNFSKLRKNILMYGGTALRYQKWKKSENIAKLFLCDSKRYQSELLFLLYAQKNKEANYLFLPEDLSEKDIAELTAFKPDTEKRNGNLYENWKTEAVHDLHDVCKMALCCRDIAASIYPKKKFAHGEARVFKKNPVLKTKKPKIKKPPLPRRPLFPR